MASGSARGWPRGTAYPLAVPAVAAGVFAADQVTKLIASDRLVPAYLPHPLIGDAVRLTLVHNPGAAFGINLGAASRPAFIVVTVAALYLLFRLWRETVAGDWPRAFAIALVGGGAAGNLLDRLRSARGVVDFLDVGVGASRWPTFNVADIAITTGAIALALVLWREDVARAARLEAAGLAPEANDAAAADAPIHG